MGVALLAFMLTPRVSSQVTPRVSSQVTLRPECTRTGTSGRDVISGTKGPDVICALAGNDYVAAGGHADLVLGSQDSDTLVGGYGRDRLKGGQGNDRIFSVDGVIGNDLVWGGVGGQDWCFIDRGDRTHGCEHVSVGQNAATSKALRRAFGGLVAFGDVLQDAIPPSYGGPECTNPNPPPHCD
jgi:Ca2+-binding RTX toxin-like protein